MTNSMHIFKIIPVYLFGEYYAAIKNRLFQEQLMMSKNVQNKLM